MGPRHAGGELAFIYLVSSRGARTGAVDGTRTIDDIGKIDAINCFVYSTFLEVDHRRILI
jgi:hypothetical protein